MGSNFFCITAHEKNLSPQCMRFGPWWIYDLSAFHLFWREQATRDAHGFCGSSLWEALLKAYDIHLFSPLKKIEPLARHYLTSHQIPSSQHIGAEHIRDILDRFSHLGLKKVEHLRRLSRAGVQRRWGRAWGQLWEGLFEPQKALWLWQNTPQEKVIKMRIEFEDSCFDFLELLEAIRSRLQNLEKSKDSLRLGRLTVTLVSSQNDEDLAPLELSFAYAPLLRQESAWICKLLGERLAALTLTSPLLSVDLNIFPAPPSEQKQLSLFQSAQENEKIFRQRLQTFADKMKDEGIHVFEPESQPSHLPEESWKAVPPSTQPTLFFKDCFRPLFLAKPKVSVLDDTEIRRRQLKASEQLSWFDCQGVRHERHYFWMRDKAAWRWIFRDERGSWFEQGLLE